MGNFTIGIIFIIIGVIFLIAIDRRQFYRRVEREKMGEGADDSYTKVASKGLVEGTIIIISRLMIILGGVLVLFVLFDALCPGSCKW